MISVYEAIGIEIGIKQGFEKGIELGIVIGKRQMLLRQLWLKFGDLPDSMRLHIEALSTATELDQILDRYVTANTLADLGLPDN